MPRKPRIQFPYAVYHVTARGNRQQPIFFCDQDREDCIELLARASFRFNLEIFAFCLMDNHYHLFVRTPEANLARAMKWLNQTLTVRTNKRHSLTGHLLQGRYHSVLVVDDGHWHRLSTYVHLNPVRAGMVDDPAHYEWSSFLDYVRKRKRHAWVRREAILAGLGGSEAARMRAYRRACKELGNRRPDFANQLERGFFLGARDKLEELLDKVGTADGEKVAQGLSHASPRQVDPKAQIERVAQVFGLEAEKLFERRRNFVPRQAAFCHLVENLGMSVKETASVFDVGPTAVSNGSLKFSRLLEEDVKLKQAFEHLKC